MVNFVKIRIIRTLIITFSFLLSGVVFGQSRYECQSSDYWYKEDFKVNLTRDSYGIQFESRNACLTNTIEKGIKRFFQTTRYKEYYRMGKYTLRIVKKGDDYFVVQEENPSNLIKLQ